MDREWRDEWCRALRSGEFVQSRWQLRYDTRERCCLGVLCDVRPDVTWSGVLASFEGEESSGGLPRSLRAELGISDQAHDTLTQMNDVQDKSFARIADWIEANL